MPGTAAHLTILEQQTKKAAADPARFGIVAAALQSHPKEAALGAIGPDMIFWADWGEYTSVVNAIFEVYKTYDEVYESIMAIFGPIQDHVDKDLEMLTGELTTEISETVTLLEGIVQMLALNYLTESWNYYGLLKPKFQVNLAHDDNPSNSAFQPIPVTKWNWLDFLHHRGTGRFTKALIARAKQSGDGAQMAYAYGWLSHVTADVVGHAYVNLAVGGPWRSHYQRHHIQENFMDVWTYGFYNSGASMPSSAQPGEIPFNYAGWQNLNSAGLHEKFNLGDDLPLNLQNLIADTLAQVYGSAPRPAINIGPAEVNRAYQMLSFAVELMTGKDRHIPVPQPPSIFGDAGDPFDLLGKLAIGLATTVADIIDAFIGGDEFSLSALIEAIINLIGELLSYIRYVVELLLTFINAPLTYPVRYALYQIQLALYETYRALRWALVIAGYLYPEPEELASGYAQQFINPTGIVTGVPRLEWMPFADGRGESEKCGAYPSNGIELPAVVPAPYTRYPLNYPFWFIEGEPTDRNVEAALAGATTPAQTLQITQSLFFGAPGYQGSLGSAIDLFLRRAREIAAADGDIVRLTLPNWNLDADRGYGFKCWSHSKPLAPPDSPADPPSWPVPPETGVSIAYLPNSA